MTAVDVDTARADAFDAFIKNVNAAKTGVSLFTSSSRPNPGVESIPTGAASLDDALGVGGLPRGRIVEIYGPEHSGKCLVKDTLIPTNWGLLTVEEIFAKCGLRANSTVQTTDISHHNLQVVNEYGVLEAVSHLTHNGKRPVRRVTTNAGRHIRVTDNHPVRVLKENGHVVWSCAKNLKPGDVLLGILSDGGGSATDHVTFAQALLLGYLVGEGSLNSSRTIGFTQKDQQIRDEFISLMQMCYPSITPRVYGIDVRFNSKVAREDLAARFGLDCVKAPKKSIPSCVRQSSPKIQAAFLSALFECDGTIEGNTVTYSTASAQLAREVQALLTSLGMAATVSPKKVAAYPQNIYFNVSLGTGSSRLFLETIGFRSQRRAAQHAHIDGVPSYDEYRSIPHLYDLIQALVGSVGGDRAINGLVHDLGRASIGPGRQPLSCSRARLQQVLDWADRKKAGDHPVACILRQHLDRPATYERVVEVTVEAAEPTFDVVVPGTHSFVANGLAVHNTTLALSTCANAIRDGGNVLYVDVEHAITFDHAAWMGINLANFAVSQPDAAEDALELVDQACRSGAFSVVVIDSVASLVPRKELEAEIGDVQIGEVARLMSKALRKLAASAANSNTTVIFINQIREKIGVMFGNPETTTGGKALKFYSSVRLEVRSPPSLQIKEGTGNNQHVIGQLCKVAVRKNKVATPFKECVYPLIFDKGIDNAAALRDTAVKRGYWCVSGGGMYTLASTGETIGRGKDAVAEALRNDPVKLAELDSALFNRNTCPIWPADDPGGVEEPAGAA